jgi:hypothetical protein
MKEKGIVIPRPDTTKFIPGTTHHALAALYRHGYLKYIISQNTG